MNRVLAILLAAILSPSVFAQDETVNHRSEEFDKLLSAQFEPGGPGAVALVARNDRVMYSKAFGMANLEHNVPMHVNAVFKIGSITKQFTAVAVLQLAEQGRLSLQDEITRFIPDYPTHGHTITVEHLLTHTSGIPNYSGLKEAAQRGPMDFSPAEIIDWFKNEPLRFPPGTKWEYSNSGYVLLGYVIEIVSGKTYGEYLEENIFRPAQMRSSLYADDIRLVKHRADGYAKAEKGFVNVPHISMSQPYAAGAILSTVEDLFQWNRALLSNTLITKDSRQRAWTPYVLADGTETTYGYGWRFGYIQDSPSIWHGGWINGFITMAMYLPKEDVFVAVFSNCEDNSPEDVTAKLAAVAIGQPYEYDVIPTDSVSFRQYEGVYETADGQFMMLIPAGNRLYSRLGWGPKVEMLAYQEDKYFLGDDVFHSISFHRDSAGNVKGFVSRNRKAIVEWQKTDKPLPSPDGLALEEGILRSYVGEYRLARDFTFTVTLELPRLYVQATGQEKLEMVAESETRFFLKANDAQIEFVRGGSGPVTKAIVRQGGRVAEAIKIR